ncbi:hypothetical protein [Pseudomonas sp. PS02290]|uniref:hypothetical protein n=1 Tax=Pseudomonas sp. PS02290 TaxID=2991430 RepID=UPI00249C791A|nr:hypothetical protein [Pseudomonas sp. PS02290]
MAGIAASIRKSLTDFDLGELDFSMMHACMAIDGTARKAYPEMRQNGPRFTRLLRDNYEILRPLGVPIADIVETRWPVTVRAPSAAGGLPDIADLIYGIHRCTHGHGDDLPEGFELMRNANSPEKIMSMIIEAGKVRLSDCVIFALLAICVVSPVNESLRISSGHITYRDYLFPINEWWGKREQFLEILQQYNDPTVSIDFAHMMPSSKR